MGKSEEILTVLTEELKAGKYPADSRFPSEYDLALRFDVHRSTANRAITALVGAGYLIRGKRGEGTKVARVPAANNGRILYIGALNIYPQLRTFHGIMQAANARNYSLEFACPSEDTLAKYLARINAQSDYKGIITAGYLSAIDGYCPAKPVYYIDMPDPVYHEDRHNVATPNQEAEYRLVQKLLEKGHREIVIYAPDNYPTCNSYYRVKGALKAMAEYNIARLGERIFIALEYADIDALQVLKKIKAKFPQVSAIVTVSDALAASMLNALATLGIPYPGSIAVTGFGNWEFASRTMNFPSVEQHNFQLGAMACNNLLDIIERKGENIPHVQYMDYELVRTEMIQPPPVRKEGEIQP